MQAKTTSASHPDGDIREYVDAMNRPQTSVDGPKGHVLVTAGRHGAYGATFDVWRSDSIRTILGGADFKRAIRTACVAAGLDPKTVEFGARS